jgi:hypothetical protein
MGASALAVAAGRFTRCPSWLRGPARAAYLMQQDRYDRLLKAEGFVDLEDGDDVSAVSKSRDGETGPHARQITRGVAEFWSQVRDAARLLPRNYRRRRLLIAVAESGKLSAAARAAGVSRMAARWSFRRFLAAHGLEDSRPARSVTSGTTGAERARRRRG